MLITCSVALQTAMLESHNFPNNISTMLLTYPLPASKCYPSDKNSDYNEFTFFYLTNHLYYIIREFLHLGVQGLC